MVRFDLYHDVTTLSGNVPKDDLNAVRNICSYRAEGYQFTKAFKEGRWDGWSTMLKGQSFPTGLCSQVIAYFDKVQRPMQFFDHRQVPELQPSPIAHLSLRPYQLDAVTRAKSATRGNIVIGTGGGKMRVAAALYLSLGCVTVLLVNNVEALHDTVAEFKTYMPDHTIGVYGDGHATIAKLTIATIQSAYKAGAALRDAILSAECIILDECHHGGAKKWYEIVSKSRAYYKFGMTGTLNRQDEKDIFLQAFSGRKICDYPVKWLIDNDYLCPVNVQFHVVGYDGDIGEFKRMSTQDRYISGIVRNAARNARVKSLVDSRGEQSALVLVNRVEHGHILSELLGAPFVSGAMSRNERRAIKSDILAGKVTCVIATSLYDESVNNPVWKFCVNAAGFSPENAQIQRLGRILRKTGPGVVAQFHDFYDSFDPKLLAHSKLRVTYLTQEGHTVTVD